MLQRCKKCGKPVYFANAGQFAAECRYCYQKNTRDTAQGIPITEEEWLAPLIFRARTFSSDEKMMTWLRTLGRTDLAEQELEKRRKLAQQRREAAREKAVQVIEKPRDLSQVQQVRKELKELAENEDDSSLISTLEAMEQELACARIRELREEAGSVLRSWSVKKIEEELELLRRYPGGEAAFQEVGQRKEQLEQEEKQRRETEIRKQKKNRRIRKTAMTAVILLAVGLFILRYENGIPRKLEEARRYASEGAYEQALILYFSLSYNLTDLHQEIKQTAAEEMEITRRAWAEALAEKGDWENAVSQAERTSSPSLQRTIRIKYAEAMANTQNYWESCRQWAKIPGSDNRVHQAYIDMILAMAEAKDYEHAIDAMDCAGEEMHQTFISLANQGITKDSLYIEWGKSLAAEGKYGEAAEKLRCTVGVQEAETLIAEWTARAEMAMIEKIPELLRAAKEEKVAAGDLAEWLRSAGWEPDTVNGLLALWRGMQEAGFDVQQAFPEGALIAEDVTVQKMLEEKRPGKEGTGISAQGSGEINTQKPLAVIRKEKDFDLRVWKEDDSWSITEESRTYEYRLMPELWMRLPESRRPASLEECTCFLVLSMEYVKGANWRGVLYPDLPLYNQAYTLYLVDSGSGAAKLCMEYSVPSVLYLKLKKMSSEEKINEWVDRSFKLVLQETMSVRDLDLADPFNMIIMTVQMEKESDRLLEEGTGPDREAEG